MHLLFDLDGTLTDSRDGIVRCFQHALHHMQGSVPAASTLARYIGAPTPLADCFAELLQTTDEELIDRAVTAYRARFETVGMFENALYPGVEDALDALTRAGFRLHVVTAKPVVFASKIVEYFRIAPYFLSVHGPDLTARQCEKASLIQQALSANQILPTEAIAIGDRGTDIAAARANDIRSIGVTWGYGDRHELADADRIVDTWHDLVACLQLTSR